jgi:hypothetical protein
MNVYSHMEELRTLVPIRIIRLTLIIIRTVFFCSVYSFFCKMNLLRKLLQISLKSGSKQIKVIWEFQCYWYVTQI